MTFSGWPAWAAMAVQLTRAQWTLLAIVAVIVVLYAATLGETR